MEIKEQNISLLKESGNAQKDELLTGEERFLLDTLAASVANKKISGKVSISPMDFMELCERHQVSSLMYDILSKGGLLSGQQIAELKKTTATVVLQNYRRLLLAKYITNAFKEQDIECALLKGASTGKFYPVPEYRKSGDLDILIKDLTKLEKAGEILEGLGFAPEDTTQSLHYASIHQIVYISSDNIAIELHTTLAEPFDDAAVNSLIQTTLSSRGDYIKEDEILSVRLPVLTDYMHGFELLVHMLHHFLASGFGLRLLCDWAVFWNRDDIDRVEQEKYLELVRETGLKTFSDTVTAICIDYLGLNSGAVSFMEIGECRGRDDLLREVLDSGEFGGSRKENMVALRGDGLFDYIREFHHQMRNNYPAASRVVLLWPVLWIMNLAGFLYNNIALKRGALSSILKNAGERGKLVKKLEIFKK